MKNAQLVLNTSGKFDVVYDGNIIITRSSKNNARTDAKRRGYIVSTADIVSSDEVAVEMPHFNINDRFGFYENFLGLVLDGVNNSIVVSGKGGLGKSFTLGKVLEERGLENDIDYTTIKGYSTARAMYRTLFENNGKVIIFDDCDSVLKNDTALNILKGALDSYDRRIITWASEGFGAADDLPSCFEFTGQVVFISNMERNKIDQAILSRSLNVDLSMTKSEAIERMRLILPDVLPEYGMSLKEDALDFLDANQALCKDLNMRSLLQVTKVRANIPNNWEQNAMYLIMQ
jgi:hypothetical protein